MPGDSALAELRRALEHDDPRVRELAVEALARREDAQLEPTLLGRLRRGASPDLIANAFDGLAALRSRDALTLIDDLLLITVEAGREVHPVWGQAPGWGWGSSIHTVLIALDADAEIRELLDRALSSRDEVARSNALGELSRWLEDLNISDERRAAWQTAQLRQRILDLALEDPSMTIRAAAAGALVLLADDDVRGALAEALRGDAAEARIAAADALARMQAQELYGEMTDALLSIVRDGRAGALRRYAATVLNEIPGGVEALYQPIQAVIGEGSPERALGRIAATLEILPDDANLFWWQGHVLRAVGRLEKAVESFERACELEGQASVIPQVLAETFLELDAPERAVNVARTAVAIDPGDAGAHATLAWSCYRAGALGDAVEAANDALGVDPVHGNAMWIVLLCQLRQENAGGSRAAWQHARRARELLSPGLDMSFVATFEDEIKSVQPASPEISALLDEIDETLRATASSRSG
jgi:tetratricopeptide (TPR) repeat protein